MKSSILKLTLCWAIFISGSGYTRAQFIVNQGQLVIGSSGYLVLDGDVVNDGGAIVNNGSFDITGDMSNQNGGSVSSGASSEMVFNGGTTQTLSGVSALRSIVIEGGSQVNLGANVSLSGGLTLTAGILNLNGQTLSLGNSATISGTPGNSNHILATSGSLSQRIFGNRQLYLSGWRWNLLYSYHTKL